MNIPVANNTTLVNVPVQSDASTAHLKVNSQYTVVGSSEYNSAVPLKETITPKRSETESNQSVLTMILSTVSDNETIQNQSVASQVPFQLEKVDVLFHPDHNPDASNETLATIMVSGHNIPSVVDKSTNTAELASNEGIGNQNIDLHSDKTNIQVPIGTADYGQLRASKKSHEKEKSISVLRNAYSFSNVNSETQLLKSSHVTLSNSESRNIRKHGRKPNKSSNTSREQEFQKLHSKNGKVFLQSTTHRGGEGRKMGSDPSASDVDVGRILDMKNTEENISDKRSRSAKVIPGEKEETNVSSAITSRQRSDTKVSSNYIKTTAVSKSNVKKTRNKIHLTNTVKDKLRQSLNIPILPKPTSSHHSLGQVPVGLQPLESSLFVIPPTPPRSQTSENITSLLHMSKSKVKIQPPAVDKHIHNYPEEPVTSGSKH